MKDWNAQALVKEVQAQAVITAEFGKNASKAIGGYASEKAAELRIEIREEEAWDEGGDNRILAHALIGGLPEHNESRSASKPCTRKFGWTPNPYAHEN